MKKILVAALLLSGCMESEPPEPTPQQQAIIDACNGGNVNACMFLERMRQAELQRRASIPPPVINNQLQPFPTMTGTRQCVNAYGQVVRCVY